MFSEDPKVYSCDADLCDPQGDTACQTVDHFRLSQGHRVAQGEGWFFEKKMPVCNRLMSPKFVSYMELYTKCSEYLSLLTYLKLSAF